MLTHIRLAVWAFGVLWSLKTISPRNRVRLWKKTGALYLAFLAFTDKQRPKDQLERALKSALLSAIYDYETDWLRVEDPEQSISFRLLEEYVEVARVKKRARDLFYRDWRGELSEHGLERGADALRFYTRYIGSEWLALYSVEDIFAFGRKLQIVDDFFDQQWDAQAHHKNCFLTPARSRFVAELKEFLDSPFFHELRRRSWVYRYVYRECHRKLKEMEALWPPSINPPW